MCVPLMCSLMARVPHPTPPSPPLSIPQPAQLAVLSWMATPIYVPARVIGPLPGFGTGVQYIRDGNLAIAYEDAWGSARLTAAVTALAMELADLAAAMNKFNRRTAWRCWARSQARALVGRLPGRSQPFIDSLSVEGSAVLNATRAAPLVASSARTSAWRSFVVGVGPSPPRYLSHRGASCPTDRSLPCDCSAYVSPAPNPTTMFGALVGGPNSVKPNAMGFHGHLDDRTSYETNEPALDYNAGWLVTTMALAGSRIDPSALTPGTLSTHDREFPVSGASAAADADAWDACVDSGVGDFPVLPAAFVADVRNASLRNIDASRFHPVGAARLRTGGWQLDGLLLALVTAGVAAAYFLGNTIAAARAGGMHQLWYEGAVRLAAARDDPRMLAALGGLAEEKGGRGGVTPRSRRHTRSLRFSPECTVTDGSGFTALLAGAAGATPDGGGAVEWLLAAGADPRALKKDGWKDTALHYAAATGSARAATALVAAAPDLAAATNFAARTPAAVARDCGHAGLADWLDAAALAATKKDAPMPPPPPVVPELTAATAAAAAEPLTEAELAEAAAFAHRGYDGWGTPGVVPAHGVMRFRVAAVTASAAWLGYLLWRALRTLDEGSTGRYVYSVVFWLTEGGFGGVWWFWGGGRGAPLFSSNPLTDTNHCSLQPLASSCGSPWSSRSGAKSSANRATCTACCCRPPPRTTRLPTRATWPSACWTANRRPMLATWPPCPVACARTGRPCRSRRRLARPRSTHRPPSSSPATRSRWTSSSPPCWPP